MRLLAYSLLSLVSIACFAQKTYRFESVTVDDGLSQSSITSMAQDKSGYLWIGTQDGLNKYDGYSFKIYRNREGDSTSLVKNFVSQILIDKQTNVWVATLGNISKYDPVTDRFTNYPLATGSPIEKDPVIFEMFESRDGSLALSTTGGLFHFDPVSKKFSVREPFSSWIGQRCGGYIETKEKGDWAFFPKVAFHKSTGSPEWTQIPMPAGERVYYNSASDDLYFLAYDDPKSSLLKYNSNHEWKNWKGLRGIGHTLEMCFLSNKTAWVATDNGINIYSPSDELMAAITTYDISTSSVNLLKDIYETRDGVIWLGTNGYGLKKYNPQTNQFSYLGPSASSLKLSHPYVDAIYTRNDTVVYVSTPAGLDVLDLVKKTTTHIDAPDRIRQIIRDDKGNTWLVGFSAIWLLQKDRIVTTSLSPSMPMLFPGGEYITLLDKGIKHTLFKERVGEVTLMEVMGDSLWIGTGPARTRLLLIDRNSREVLKEFSNAGDLKKFPVVGSIKCVFKDSKKRIWIGSNGGLSLYNEPTGDFQHYSEKDGLPNNTIYGILEDANHNLWLSTNKGLCQFDPSSKKVRNFEAFDGLQSNEFNTGAFFKSRYGTMYFGGVNGVTYFNPESISTSNPIPQSVISGVYILNNLLSDYSGHVTSTEGQSTLSLAYNENDFGFDFVGVGFSLPGRTKYRYTLENYDNDWHEIGNLNHINFTNIPPGNYIFKVRSSDPYGNWEETGASINVTIDAPIWKKPWAWAVTGVAIVVILFVLYKIRINTLKRKATRQQELLISSIQTQEHERKRISQDMHDELGAVLSISRMHLVQLREQHAKGSKDLEPAIMEATNLTEAALSTMRRISHELMPPQLEKFGLIKTLKTITSQINDAGAIEVKLVIDDEELRWPQSIELGLYRITMEMINNTLKHAGANMITIQLPYPGDRIILVYEDNGKGLPASYTIGGGFNNIETRTTIMGGTFEIVNAPSGFKARITIPL